MNKCNYVWVDTLSIDGFALQCLDFPTTICGFLVQQSMDLLIGALHIRDVRYYVKMNTKDIINYTVQACILDNSSWEVHGCS